MKNRTYGNFQSSRYSFSDSGYLCDFLRISILYHRCMGQRIQKTLKKWHLVFFFLGLCADAVGTTLMEHIAHLTHLHDEVHTITGMLAIILMFIHAMWAIWTYYKGSAKAKEHFNRFSIIVWLIWLIPYCIGIYMGMRLHS